MQTYKQHKFYADDYMISFIVIYKYQYALSGVFLYN